MSESKGIQTFQYNVSQIYLEIARAITSSSLYQLYRNKGEPLDDNNEASIRFARVAITIAFSYASLEAFCNSQLYSKYTIVMETEHFEWKLGFRDKKYKKYFKNEESLKTLIEQGELKEKLRALASVCNISPLNEANPKLWNSLCQITKEMRDFIIHPKPDPDEFQKKMNKIMEKYKPSDYYKTIEGIFSYFHEQTGREIPEWVKQNTLFSFLDSKDLLRASKCK